jgi:hypothetical protein
VSDEPIHVVCTGPCCAPELWAAGVKGPSRPEPSRNTCILCSHPIPVGQELCPYCDSGVRDAIERDGEKP